MKIVLNEAEELLNASWEVDAVQISRFSSALPLSELEVAQLLEIDGAMTESDWNQVRFFWILEVVKSVKPTALSNEPRPILLEVFNYKVGDVVVVFNDWALHIADSQAVAHVKLVY